MNFALGVKICCVDSVANRDVDRFIEAMQVWKDRHYVGAQRCLKGKIVAPDGSETLVVWFGLGAFETKQEGVFLSYPYEYELSRQGAERFVLRHYEFLSQFLDAITPEFSHLKLIAFEWETGIMGHLPQLPLPFVYEQNKMDN